MLLGRYFLISFVFSLLNTGYLFFKFQIHANLTTLYESKRYYDSHLSQFLQADSIVPEAQAIGLNRYAYVNHDPIQFVDPSGHVPQDIFSEAQKKFDHFSQFGKDFILQVDQALYQGADFFVKSTAPSDPNLDPFGFSFFVLSAIQFRIKSQSNQAAHNIHQAFSRTGFGVLDYPKRLRTVYNMEYSMVAKEANGFDYVLYQYHPRYPIGLREAERLLSAEDAARRSVPLLLLMHSSDEYHNAINSAIRVAHEREQALIDESFRGAHNLSARLGRLLSYFADPNYQRDLSGAVFLLTDDQLKNILVYEHKAVREVQIGWMSGGKPFKVSVGPLMIDEDRRIATRTADFFVSNKGQPDLFRLRVYERFSGQDYDRVTRYPHLYDPPDLASLPQARGGD